MVRLRISGEPFTVATGWNPERAIGAQAGPGNRADAQREANDMIHMIDMDPVATNLKRAYREAAPQKLPDQMQDLLRRLQEQDEKDR